MMFDNKASISHKLINLNTCSLVCGAVRGGYGTLEHRNLSLEEEFLHGQALRV